MLQLEHISWNTPDGTPVLKDLNLTIDDGKLTVITGPNGGGKSTLAKIIVGIEQPATGRILLDGKDITGLDATERAKAGISFAFQQPVRFKGVKVRRLLELAAGTKKLKEAQLNDLLANVGLNGKDYLDREVNATLSGGEIKRIEIATVLARGANVSIFDEPEAGIDLWSFSSLIKVFQEMRGKIKGNMLIISHQERILQIADEVVVLANGKIRERGAAMDMLKNSVSNEKILLADKKQEVIL